MGNLVWHEYSRLVALTASICEFYLRTNWVAELTVGGRYRMGKLLGIFLPQVLLGLCQWYSA